MLRQRTCSQGSAHVDRPFVPG